DLHVLNPDRPRMSHNSEFQVPSFKFKVSEPCNFELETWNLFLLRRRRLLLRAEPAGRELGHVVDDDEAHQQEQEDEADLLYALAHTHRELHAGEAEQPLDEKHEDHAAVEDGYRQEVEDAEVEAEEAEHLEDAAPAVV